MVVVVVDAAVVVVVVVGPAAVVVVVVGPAAVVVVVVGPAAVVVVVPAATVVVVVAGPAVVVVVPAVFVVVVVDDAFLAAPGDIADIPGPAQSTTLSQRNKMKKRLTTRKLFLPMFSSRSVYNSRIKNKR